MVSANDRLFIIGGGAAAFANGHVDSTASYALKRKDREAQQVCDLRWSGSRTISNDVPTIKSTETSLENLAVAQIPRVRITSAKDFEKILRDRKPVVIESLDFGPCLKRWSSSYMTDKVGPDTQV